MPIYQVGHHSWRWGKHGKIYSGAYGYEKALRQGHRIPRRSAIPLKFVKSRLRIRGSQIEKTY